MACGAWTRRRTSWGTASPMCAAWKAALTPGRSKSIPRCRATTCSTEKRGKNMAEPSAPPEVWASAGGVGEQRGGGGMVRVGAGVDPKPSQEGRVPGAIAWDGPRQLSDTVQRDIVSREMLEKL